jgi:hypothetical protein
MDGLNEAGLAAAAFYFPTSAEYTLAASVSQSFAAEAQPVTKTLFTNVRILDGTRGRRRRRSRFRQIAISGLSTRQEVS